ncbi:MAG TPA: NAD(P)-binding domain-containing protein, partial [Bradyrhizobium sp.]|nr:NAD(P)-binding domain-containing protein [Bradyrhizobium sp.]
MAGIGETDARSAEKLGYLGLGMMGFPMTRRLVSAGHDVTVWNRSPGKAAALVAAGGATVGRTAAAGCAGARVRVLAFGPFVRRTAIESRCQIARR